MTWTEDLSVFFGGMDAKPVTAGAISGLGYLDHNSEMVFDSSLLNIEHLLTVPTATFGDLSSGDAIVVGGAPYKLETRPRRFGDGAFCRVSLIPVVVTGLRLLLESSIMLDSLTTSGNIDSYAGTGTIDSLTGIGPMALLLETGEPLLLEP